MTKHTLLLSLFIAIAASQVVNAGGHEHKAGKMHKKFTECAAVRMKEINLKHLAEKETSKITTAVPEGWTVVSGAGGEGHPKLLICR